MTMQIICHRVNTLSKLLNTDQKYGVEVDIRSFGDRLIIDHEPYTVGESFEEWVEAYRHGTLILNVKEEGLESQLVNKMKGKGVENFFFLDQSFPFLVKWSMSGERRCAVRVSEFESIETALSLAGRVEWVWVDCFSCFPLGEQDAKRLKDAGFKLCLVSPELHGRDANVEIPQMASLLKNRNISADAVCTKYPDLWESVVMSL